MEFDPNVIILYYELESMNASCAGYAIIHHHARPEKVGFLKKEACMRIAMVWRAFLILSLIALLSPGCTPTPEPVENAEVSMTYTGEGCGFDSPDLLRAGPATLQFFNEGEMRAAINAVKLAEGKTFDDLFETMGDPEGPLFGHAPDWTEELGTYHWIKPGDVYTWEGDLAPGLYTVVAQQLSGAGWYCGRFTVVE